MTNPLSPPPRHTPARWLGALTAAVALVLAACGDNAEGTPGGDAETTSSTQASGSGEPSAQSPGETTQTQDAAQHIDAGEADLGDFPITVEAPNGAVTLTSRPERIVSLSPSATEILFAIGAGDQIIAVDAFSTYPENAPTTELSGWDPNVEAVIGYDPDLVVISNDANELVGSLAAVGIPAIVNEAPVDVESGYDGMALLGLATGNVDQAAEAIATMRSEMEQALAAAPAGAQLRIYHELDDTFFSASSYSFIGSVYEAMGAVNIADEADMDRHGYPQLTEEALITADPQLIVIPTDVSYGVEDVLARPGWGEVSAIRNGSVVAVDSDISSRWGPRLPQLVELLTQAFNEATIPAER